MDVTVMTQNPPPMPHFPPPPRFQVPPPAFNPPPRVTPAHAGGGNFMHTQRHTAVNQSLMFDGKRMRQKSILRKTVDYNSSVVNYLESRLWTRDRYDMRAIQPDSLYAHQMLPPPAFLETPMNCVPTKFVRASTNKVKCPIFCVCWTPEGRRLVTGASSGEFTLWNGLTFNFETILQAHDTSVRSMVWSHNDVWMLTSDHAGFVKYWQTNMNNVKMFQAHKEAVRGLSFCPSDQKFATCSDDGTVRVWDFLRCHEEKILRGHGADVKCLDWHPQKALIASGSKDSQQPLKLWDPRSGQGLCTVHAHKNTVMDVRWNKNGNWLLTASRDHLLKLFDVRNMKEEVQSFKGHKKEATTIAWHPIHESLFTSGGSDGSLMFWLVGQEKEVGSIDEAHDMMVWSLAWHPLGHILVSGSNDHTTKFWTRNRPGDKMRDKYNLNLLPVGISEDLLEYDDISNIPNLPGMGLEHGLPEHLLKKKEEAEPKDVIPGLDFGLNEKSSGLGWSDKGVPRKKIPYAKPVPRDFEMAWKGGKQPAAHPQQNFDSRRQNGQPSNRPPQNAFPGSSQGPRPGGGFEGPRPQLTPAGLSNANQGQQPQLSMGPQGQGRPSQPPEMQHNADRKIGMHGQGPSGPGSTRAQDQSGAMGAQNQGGPMRMQGQGQGSVSSQEHFKMHGGEGQQGPPGHMMGNRGRGGGLGSRGPESNPFPHQGGWQQGRSNQGDVAGFGQGSHPAGPPGQGPHPSGPPGQGSHPGGPPGQNFNPAGQPAQGFRSGGSHHGGPPGPGSHPAGPRGSAGPGSSGNLHNQDVKDWNRDRRDERNEPNHHQDLSWDSQPKFPHDQDDRKLPEPDGYGFPGREHDGGFPGREEERSFQGARGMEHGRGYGRGDPARGRGGTILPLMDDSFPGAKKRNWDDGPGDPMDERQSWEDRQPPYGRNDSFSSMSDFRGRGGSPRGGRGMMSHAGPGRGMARGSPGHAGRGRSMWRGGRGGRGGR